LHFTLTILCIILTNLCLIDEPKKKSGRKVGVKNKKKKTEPIKKSPKTSRGKSQTKKTPAVKDMKDTTPNKKASIKKTEVEAASKDMTPEKNTLKKSIIKNKSKVDGLANDEYSESSDESRLLDLGEIFESYEQNKIRESDK
jgi:hypothetical protein